MDHLTGYGGLTGDEAYELALAQRPFGHMLHLFTFEANGILYPLVLRPLLDVESPSLPVLRLPACAAGVLSVPALYWAGSALVRRREALCGAALLAISPLAIAYSQLARPYVFAMLFATLAYGCLARTRSGGARYWIGYVAAMVLAAYSSVPAVVGLVPAQAAMVTWKDRRYLARWLGSLGVLAICLLPLAVLISIERSKRDALYWLDKPNVQGLLSTGSSFFAGAVPLAVAVIAVAWLLVRRPSHGVIVAAAWAIAPVAAVWLAAQVSPIFWIGYLLPALPGAMLAVGAAVLRLARPLALGALLVLVVLSARHAVPAAGYHAHGWRQAAATLRAAGPRTRLVFDIPDGLSAAGFYDGQFRANGRLVVSEWRDEPVPRHATLLDDPGGYAGTRAGPPSVALVRRLVAHGHAVDVLIYEAARQGDVERSPGLVWARRACSYRAEWLGGVRVVRVSRCKGLS